MWKWKEIQELLWKKSVISRVAVDIKLNINNKKHLNVNDLSTKNFNKRVSIIYVSSFALYKADLMEIILGIKIYSNSYKFSINIQC